MRNYVFIMTLLFLTLPSSSWSGYIITVVLIFSDAYQHDDIFQDNFFPECDTGVIGLRGPRS